MSTYYVSSFDGNDKNDGLSKENPWRSLFRVNEAKFEAGDMVLLEKNSVFENQYLHLSVRGSKDNIIRISSYGAGSKPVINCGGNGIWYQDYGRGLDAKTHTYKGYVSYALKKQSITSLEVM